MPICAKTSKLLIRTYEETGSISETARLWHTSRQVVRKWVRRFHSWAWEPALLQNFHLLMILRSRELIIAPNNDNKAVIRLARAGDAERIAALCQQLGYPTSQEGVQRRLNQIQQDEQHAVYVAELPDGHVVGWVHVHVCQLVVADPHAEIGGLVVDEGYRRRGIGRRLMQQAEQWAREKGCWAVYLRSNVVRKDAHAFYEEIGYSNVKTSMAFRKAL